VVRGKTRGGNGLVIEHVSGRDETFNNLCVSCRRCNSTKNRRTAEEWMQDIDKEIDAVVYLIEKRKRIEDLLSKLDSIKG